MKKAIALLLCLTLLLCLFPASVFAEDDAGIELIEAAEDCDLDADGSLEFGAEDDSGVELIEAAEDYSLEPVDACGIEGTEDEPEVIAEVEDSSEEPEAVDEPESAQEPEVPDETPETPADSAEEEEEVVKIGPNTVSDVETFNAAETSGNWGDQIAWSLDDGVLLITGTGDMDDFAENDSRAWLKSRDDIVNVVIEDGITSIGAFAFYGCANLAGAQIPDSVTNIGDGAFSGCSSLPQITIPDGTTIINSRVFENCGSLASVTLSDSVTRIGYRAFYNCTSLATMTPHNAADVCPKCGGAPGAAVTENKIPASCSSAGSYDEVVYCSACHEELSRVKRTLPKLAHTPGQVVRENEIAPTYEKEGSYDAVVYCSVCGEEISRTKVIVDKLHDTDINITWTSEDGAEILKNEQKIPSYTPRWTDAEPVKANDADWIYVFDGWTIDGTTVYNNEAKGSVLAFVPLSADTTFKAHFVKNPHNEEYQRALSLTDSVAIKWRISKIADGADASKYSVVVTYKGQSTTYTSGLTSGIVLAYCAAKEMTEEATVQVFYDGVEIKSLTYSVNDYCNEMLAKEAASGENKWTRLMQATQDYGYTAMIYYNYPGARPDGGGAALAYAQAVPALGSTAAATVVKTPSADIGISAVNFRLITEAQTILSVAFVKADGSTKTAADYVFTVDGVVIPSEKVTDANGVFEIRVTGTPAKNLNRTVTIIATEKNGSRSASFAGSSIGYMSTAAYSDKAGDSLKNMVKALYNYHLEAKNAMPS